MNRALFAAVAVLTATLAACASTPAPAYYAMPTELGQALPPGDADPTRAEELAEGALHLLNPERPGGPDYRGAARMCLLAVDVARSRAEAALRRACIRTAARSALRSGDRQIYVEAVDRWEHGAPRSARVSGELAIHLAIRDRLVGRDSYRATSVPPHLRRLLLPADRRP